MIRKKELKRHLLALELKIWGIDNANNMDEANIRHRFRANEIEVERQREELKDVKREIDRLRLNVLDSSNGIFNIRKELESLKKEVNDLRVAYNHSVPTLISDVKSIDGNSEYKFYKLLGDVKRCESYLSEVLRIESARLVPDKSPLYWTHGFHTYKSGNGRKQYFVVANDFDDAIKIVEDAFGNLVYWA